MASEGKQSPFTIKNIAFSAVGVVLTSWAIPKALDTYLDTTFLTTMKDWPLGVWAWLIQEEPQPNWLLVAFPILSLLLCCVAFYFLRLYSSTLDSLNEAEVALSSKSTPIEPKVVNPPSKPVLVWLPELEHKIIMFLVSHAESGTPVTIERLGEELKLSKMELDVSLGELLSKQFVRTTYNTLYGTTALTLLHNGKAYALKVRSEVKTLVE